MSKKVALMCGHGRSVDGSWDPGCAYGKYTEAGLMLPITKAAKLRQFVSLHSQQLMDHF